MYFSSICLWNFPKMWCKYWSPITASPYSSAGILGGEWSVGDGTRYERHGVGSASGRRFTTSGQQLDLSGIFPQSQGLFGSLLFQGGQLCSWCSGTPMSVCMLAKSELIPSPMHSSCVTALVAKDILRHFWMGTPGNLFVYWNDSTLPAGPCVKPSQAVYIYI